jgi:DNA-binding response OmpR family regulator
MLPGRSSREDASGSRPRRILIADPDRDVSELFGRVIRGTGHKPLVLTPARLEAEAPPDVDLLLLEPALPGALQLAQALRARRPNLPIVCASVYEPTSPAIGDLLVLLQPLAYLPKPFPLAELKNALEFALAIATTEPAASH